MSVIHFRTHFTRFTFHIGLRRIFQLRNSLWQLTLLRQQPDTTNIVTRSTIVEYDEIIWVSPVAKISLSSTVDVVSDFDTYSVTSLSTV